MAAERALEAVKGDVRKLLSSSGQKGVLVKILFERAKPPATYTRFLGVSTEGAGTTPVRVLASRGPALEVGANPGHTMALDLTEYAWFTKGKGHELREERFVQESGLEAQAQVRRLEWKAGETLALSEIATSVEQLVESRRRLGERDRVLLEADKLMAARREAERRRNEIQANLRVALLRERELENASAMLRGLGDFLSIATCATLLTSMLSPDIANEVVGSSDSIEGFRIRARTLKDSTGVSVQSLSVEVAKLSADGERLLQESIDKLYRNGYLNMVPELRSLGVPLKLP